MKKVLIVSTSVFSAIALCLGLANCSGSTAENKQHRVLDSSTYKLAEPSDFDGPYASDIAKDVQMNGTDYFYNIVKDGKITDQEFQESKSKLEQCIVEKNYKVNFAGPEQFEAATIPLPKGDEDGLGPADNVADQCDKDSAYSYVSALYYKQLWNPQKEDLTNYAIECLTKLGYLPPNVTAEEYKGVFSSSAGVPDFISVEPIKETDPTISGTGYELDAPFKNGVKYVDSGQSGEPLEAGVVMIKSNGVKLPKQRLAGDKEVFIPFSDMIRCTLTPKIVLEGK
ncbi:MAG: hypothetical protein LBT85_02295 [Bifidobacteriaceae bacterium]|jgi:hypothetical protein|nr:hypothetical protein [Bifidobacteriaceae bacterium]